MVALAELALLESDSAELSVVARVSRPRKAAGDSAWNALVADLIAPALRAGDGDEFVRMTNNALGAFQKRSRQLGGGGSATDSALVTNLHLILAKRAHRFGGYRWSDAVRFALLTHDNSEPICIRLIEWLKAQPLRDAPDAMRAKQALLEARGHRLTFTWAIACLLVVTKQPALANNSVREALLKLIVDSPNRAFRAVRGFELSQEKDVDLPLEAPILEAEVAELEAEAHQCAAEALQIVENLNAAED